MEKQVLARADPMKIMKESKGNGKKTLIWKDAEVADNPLQHVKGIMFRKKIIKPLLFVFGGESSVSIHSYFCIPFDIIYLDKFGKIVKIIENVEPNSTLLGVRCKYIIECKPGEARKKKLKKRDILSF